MRRGFACRVFQTHPLCEPEYAGGHRFLWLAPLRSREIRRVGGSLRIILAPATTSTVLSEPTHRYARGGHASVQAIPPLRLSEITALLLSVPNFAGMSKDLLTN